MAKAVADVNEEIQGGYASNDADSKFSPLPLASVILNPSFN